MLVPNRMFGRYADVTPEFLSQENIRTILVDIDNTLAPYEQSCHDGDHEEWIGKLRRAGIKVALISNNDEERVRKFVGDMDVPWYAECGKPRKKYIKKALRELGGDAKSAAILGDQIFTDCLAARINGMKAYIVPPLKDKKTLFFRFKRALEKPVIRRYKKQSRRFIDGKEKK